MRNFRYVWYQKVELKLTDFLHVGGEETEFSMASDGNGEYILPASGIAGAIKAYLTDICPGVENYLGKKDGDKTLDSRVCYYDATCQNVRIESRKGIRIEPKTATAAAGGIYTLYTIGEGMQTELRMQAFLETEEECQELDGFFVRMLSGIQQGHLTFGAKKTIGGGRFQVVKTGNQILDMEEEKDFLTYLTGTEKIFQKISFRDYEVINAEERRKGVTEFILNAEIRDGLIVKSGERDLEIEVDGKTKNLDARNMRKSIDGELCYYIPGSTIKGAVRGYGEKIGRTLGISSELMTEIFGGEVEKQKYRSHIKTENIVLAPESVSKVIYNRIKIDRWLGSVIEGANTSQEILTTKEGATIPVSVQTDMKDERKQKLLNGLVFLAMRDIGLGQVPLGSGSGVGFGRLTGKTLLIDGEELSFSEKGFNFNESNMKLKEKIESWLLEVERCRENQ